MKKNVGKYHFVYENFTINFSYNLRALRLSFHLQSSQRNPKLHAEETVFYSYTLTL